MRKVLAALTATTALVVLTACSSAKAERDATPASQSASQSSSTTAASVDGTAVTITAAGRTFNATINNSDVSKDFLATLPKTLTWNRNAEIEYITELGKPLTETGPFYTDVQAGDIVYYNPLDSITIIYAPTSSVPTLTKMGQITSDLDDFKDLPDKVDLRIELA